jgi:hypothetical protein
MKPSDQDTLLEWAQDYWTRTTPSSFAGHERLYDIFEGRKRRLRTRDEIAAFIPSQPSFR